MEYVRVGDYFVPALKLEPEPRPIGRWGRLYRTYLQEHHPIQFCSLTLSGRLYSRLADINEQAMERLDLLTTQMAEAQEITEALMETNPLAWVGAMNGIRSQAEEIVLQEIIYSQEAEK